VSVRAEVISAVPSSVDKYLSVRKHQFATLAQGSWPNGGALKGVICVRYKDRMSGSERHTDSPQLAAVAAQGRNGT
jgi:hypothetical protein